jgi:hypothetical protein
LFSETYGYIRFKDEWDIPFGLNRRGNLVFWLGDLNETDDTYLSIIKPFNIESDHQLIDSEFYAAQMCCTWSQPNKELNIYYKKMNCLSKLKGFTK